MVWFQCEDCGDNLKKPKLLNHFRCCSAYKLSCIDCGEVFGQHNVESHTQCITEAEKYGPKGQANVSNGKPQKDLKQKPEVDINVGLSERPPWFCSLCNTNATSKQTLLLHADGKKHRGKARGFHAAKQQASEAKETKNATENNATAEAPENKEAGEIKTEDSSKVAHPSGVENGDSKLNKKRKHTSENKDGSDVSKGLRNGEVIGIKGTETEVKKGLKKAKHSAKEETAKSDPTSENDIAKKKIKWKKLITSALQSNPDGVMKFKKLAKFVVKSLEESGFTEGKKQVPGTLEQTINSSSRFVVDGKYVRLVTSS